MSRKRKRPHGDPRPRVRRTPEETEDLVRAARADGAVAMAKWDLVLQLDVIREARARQRATNPGYVDGIEDQAQDLAEDLMAIDGADPRVIGEALMLTTAFLVGLVQQDAKFPDLLNVQVYAGFDLWHRAQSGEPTP